MDSDVLIEELLTSGLMKRPSDVVELYLGNSKLEHIKSLARFKNLQRLWLNSNKLRNLMLKDNSYSFLKTNYQIVELHLQNNEINTISGALSQLHCLKILMLQSNQLADLYEVLTELKQIDTLERINLFGNPISFDDNYRSLTVFSLPCVKVLDRETVTKNERLKAQSIHDTKAEYLQEGLFIQKKNVEKKQKVNNFLENKQSNGPTNRKKEADVTNTTVFRFKTFNWKRVKFQTPTMQQSEVEEEPITISIQY